MRWLLITLALLAPVQAFASTTTDLVTQLAGLFYIIVGLTVAIAILLMCIGLILWSVRLGTDQTYREQAIHIMEWAIATLFTLILILGAVEFIQTHTSDALYAIAVLLVILVAWIAATSGLFSGGEKKEEEKE